MKFIKNNLKYILLALAVGLGLFVIRNQNIFKTVPGQTYETQSIPASQYFGQELAKELDTVWEGFEKVGITKQRYEQAKQQHRERYLRSDFPGGTKQVSQETTQFVRGILQELGLDPTKITIVGFNDISPAAATEKVIYVNEQEFNNYSKPAQRFVIGHEIQHILHKDNCSRYTLELICNSEVEKNQKDHPLCQYNRYKEKRADIKTATQSLEWAEGYVAFAKEWYKRAGDNPGITHPLNKDRIVLAQQIFDHVKRQPIV